MIKWVLAGFLILGSSCGAFALCAEPTEAPICVNLKYSHIKMANVPYQKCVDTVESFVAEHRKFQKCNFNARSNGLLPEKVIEGNLTRSDLAVTNAWRIFACVRLAQCGSFGLNLPQQK